MFRKTAVMLLALGVSFTAMADRQSEALLVRLANLFREYGDYSVAFTVSSDGMDDVRGEYVVSGNRYHIEVDGQKQFSDGVNRYEVYPADEEIVIDRVDLESRNMLANPTRAFEFAPEEFESTYKGRARHRNTDCDVMELKPVSDIYGTGVITLYMKAGDGVPQAIIYNYDGQQIDISIDKIRSGITPDPELFRFDPARYSGFEVIDFR